MEREIRRKDRALSEEDAKEILRNGEYGILSTVSEDGQPYGVPVSYCFTGETIYFHSAVEGHKLDNLTRNPRVSFCVVGHTQVIPIQFGTKYESAIVFGEAVEVPEDKKDAALFTLVQKYSPEHEPMGHKYIQIKGPSTRVFEICIQSITGKAKR